ncbi:hypothetical protein E4T47_02227 [Aureobasidium subglaciale]|nr:hypothetical protein E4T47_02227 [Aureobasidium subglaciale]
MVLSNVLHALRNRRPWLEPAEVASPVLPNSPSKSTTSNMSTLTNSIRRNRLMTTKKHTLHDPRTPFPPLLDDVVWNGPQLCGNIVSFDPNAPSTPTKQCTSPLDPASIEEEEDKDEKDDAKFFAHTELVRPASIVFARYLSRGRSVIPVPGQDHDAIQLFVRFLYSGNVNSNVADACSFKGGCETLNFKLHDNSFTQLMTPDDEEKLLVKAYLFGYSYSCWTFCDAVIDTLICKIIGQKRTPVLHNLLDLSTDCGSFYPLKILIAHLALYTWTDNQFCGFALAHRFDRIDHVRFWADVGDYNAVHKTGTYGLPKAPWRKSSCHYHVHASYPKMEYTCYTQSRQG